jgi:hypothetical protein
MLVVADPLVEHLVVQHSDQSTQSRLGLLANLAEDIVASPLVDLAVAYRPFQEHQLASQPELDSIGPTTSGSELHKDSIMVDMHQVVVGKLITEEDKRQAKVDMDLVLVVGRLLAFQVADRMALVVGRKVRQQEGTSLDSFLASVAHLAFLALHLDSKLVASMDPTWHWRRHMLEAVHMD